MKIFIVLIIAINACFAEQAMYGTTNNPQINGAAYDVHKPFIEPNQGYQVSNNEMPTNSQQEIIVKPANEATKSHELGQIAKSASFKDDKWASDPNLEKALRHAASEGKLNYVLDQAKSANVPPAVALVPIVESNYNRNAVSPKGAGGAWQLMPKTAGDYGLSSSQRFDFTSSTGVAIQLLNDLYQQFGNWALVFAAYNCGSRCVVTALKNNPNAKSIDDLRLPLETKTYVHRIVEFSQLLAGLDNIKSKENN